LVEVELKVEEPLVPKLPVVIPPVELILETKPMAWEVVQLAVALLTFVLQETDNEAPIDIEKEVEYMLERLLLLAFVPVETRDHTITVPVWPQLPVALLALPADTEAEIDIVVVGCEVSTAIIWRRYIEMGFVTTNGWK
jgi:hypothetical protein